MRIHLEVAVAPDWRPLVPASDRMMGGTEALAVRLARLLVDEGHEVTLCGGGQAHEHAGVRFLADQAPPESPDRWIAVGGHGAGAPDGCRRIYWSHAAQLPVDAAWDEVIAVSGYHGRLLEGRLGHEVTVIPGGAEICEISAEGDRFLYASSPDRGLHRLLALWPALWDRFRRPLSIAYDVRGVLARRGAQPGPLGDRLRAIAPLLDQPGVVVHPCLDHDELAALRARSLALLYTLDPVLPQSELYALSVLEACAAGVPPILAPVDCFPEEYGDAARFVEGFAPADWVAATEEVLTDRGSWSARARRHATTRTWAAWEDAWRAVIDRDDRRRPPDEATPIGVVLSDAASWARRWLSDLDELLGDRQVVAAAPAGWELPERWERGPAAQLEPLIADPASGAVDAALAAGRAAVAWCPGFVRGQALDVDADRAGLALAERGSGLLVGLPSRNTLDGALAVSAAATPPPPRTWTPPVLST